MALQLMGTVSSRLMTAERTASGPALTERIVSTMSLAEAESSSSAKRHQPSQSVQLSQIAQPAQPASPPPTRTVQRKQGSASVPAMKWRPNKTGQKRSRPAERVLPSPSPSFSSPSSPSSSLSKKTLRPTSPARSTKKARREDPRKQTSSSVSSRDGSKSTPVVIEIDDTDDDERDNVGVGEEGDSDEGIRIDLASDEILEQAVLHAQAGHGEERIDLVARRVTFHLDVEVMYPVARDACGLPRDAQDTSLSVVLDCRAGFRRDSAPPLVEARLTSRPLCQTTSTAAPDHDFVLGAQLVNVANKVFEGRWRCKTESLLADVYDILVDRMANSGCYCIQCDAKLVWPGLKPTACDGALCRYQLENLGIGASLSQLGRSRVEDLLIVTTAAAARHYDQQPGVMPNLPLSGDGVTPMCASDVAVTLDSVPASKDLCKAALTETLTSEQKRVLRWTLATNKAHIVEVLDKDRLAIKGAELTYDHLFFRVYNSTREHDAAFAALVAKHGSFYAFHGSALSNWHSILRTNLKNLSHTTMMAHGCHHGSGIYLAEEWSEAIAYATSDPNSEHREFGGKMRVNIEARGTTAVMQRYCIDEDDDTRDRLWPYARWPTDRESTEPKMTSLLSATQPWSSSDTSV
ncbi:hypothetical protein FA10DRAFT_52837 [Acaromyces ingoldii]|uniref:PARP catalytic domain-containing protein n=1 Tax=Acaromyces ingoldii TaxID=215250 RepID=A0A316YES5_9BASI|nr:hypothetical protein FA10DRAFT_52837 [Acaromyces ingoldii]PWN86553.1 hypothetical protein FA10DRAFT_52837 [Acaromyces ingoldii]